MVKLRKKATVARRVRRQHTGAFKAQVALAALREDTTMAQLCQEFDLHANQITEWKRQLLDRAADVFGGADPPKPVDLQPLLWEAVREWIFVRHELSPRQRGLAGSAQLGFSTSP